MNEKDIRVIKTRESIEKAFFELLRAKPVSKITVTELAKLARINKGTFYLHYQDIPDLYKKTLLKNMLGPIENAGFFSDFFDDPEQFMAELDQVFCSTYSQVKTLLQEKNELLYIDQIVDSLVQKVYGTGRIAKDALNDIKLKTVFGALLTSMPHFDGDQQQKEQELIVSLIRFFFPQENSGQ